jgi:chemotaxis methyl-accepting protein methylase
VNLNYDIIFCHNVLIYMSSSAVSQVVALLAARLTLGGYLMLGPGEGPVERPAALEPIAAHGVRMLRRRSTAPGEVRS